MSWMVSDYTVYEDIKGNILYIRRSDGASIPPAPENTDYQVFLVADTLVHLCTRVQQTAAQVLSMQQVAAYQQLLSYNMQMANLIVSQYLAEVSQGLTGSALTFSLATATAWGTWRRQMIQAFIAGKSNPAAIVWPAAPSLPI